MKRFCRTAVLAVVLSGIAVSSAGATTGTDRVPTGVGSNAALAGNDGPSLGERLLGRQRRGFRFRARMRRSASLL